MRQIIALPLIFLFFIPVIGMTDDNNHNETVNHTENKYWVDFFLFGFGRINDGAGLFGYGLRVRRNLENNYVITASINRSQEYCYISGCATDTQGERIDVKITELNIGIGYLKKYGKLNIFTSAGLGYLRGTAALNCERETAQSLFPDDICESRNLDDIAVPLDFSLLWGKSMAVGLNWHFNFNTIQRFGMLSFVWAF